MPTIPQLEKLLNLDPADAFVLYALAQEYAKQNQHARALEFYDRALAVTPDDGYCYFHKARSLESLNRLADARATLTAGIVAARRAQDSKALNELQSYLDSLG